LVNIYDEGLPFHPIHRVLFGVDEAEFLAGLASYQEHSLERRRDEAQAFAEVDAPAASAHRIGLVSAKGAGLLSFPRPRAKLAAGTIQEYLDSYLKARPKVAIDYIHGTESLVALAKKPGNLGLYLPPIDKASFFGTVIRDGVMPRKTFSMGEAPEKRFYIEARRITE
ncbi:MAG TPA: DUF1015 domain-containing protein, partial [Spirochaetales bacterium]|nr:DUF1015 domain-containing protein [Spirochaetales bacterium]